MEKMKRLFRENDASENIQVKSESEKKNDTLFIGKVTKGKMVMSLQIFTHWIT